MDEILKQLQTQLEAQLAEMHDASEHAFKPSEEDPSVCEVCGWMGPDGAKMECGHTKREHAEQLLAKLKAGEVSLGEPMVMVTVIAVPRRRSLWDILFN